MDAGETFVAIKGGVVIPLIGFIPAVFEVSLPLVRIGGRLVGPKTLRRGQGFILYRHRWNGPSAFRLMDGDGHPISDRFLTYFQEPKLIEALHAANWQLYERRRRWARRG